MRKTAKNWVLRAAVCAAFVMFAGCSIFDGASDEDGQDSSGNSGQQQVTTCTVTFYPNVPADATGGGRAPLVRTYAKGSSQQFPGDLFALGGYHFVGWAKGADAKTASYQVGDSFGVYDDTCFYAVWEKNTAIVIKDNIVVEFKSDSGITEVIIPNGVTAIGDRAFLECKNLTSVTIPDGVTAIGLGSFCGCESLTSITIPESVVSIGDMAFSECPNLTIQYTGTRAQWEALRFETFGVPVVCADDSLGSENQPAVLTIQNRVVVKCDPSATGYIEIQPGVTEIAANAFDNCIYVKGIIIPEGVTKIGYEAFRFCSDMLSVQIPGSVTYIGDKAFEYCDRLETVNFSGSLSRLTTLGLDTKGFDTKTVSITCYYGNYSKSGRCYYVESGDTALTGYVIIPSGVTEIAYRAFEGCKNIVGVGIPIDVTYIGDAFDGCTNLTFIAIANMQAKCYSSVKRSYIGTLTEWIESDHEWGVSEINEKPITEITADDFAGITKIGSKAFTGWTELTYVDIPDHVRSIGDYAFSKCTSLRNATIPGSVWRIGSDAFSDCRNLRSVIILDSIWSIVTQSIGSAAFFNCTSLTSVTIADSVTSIGSSAFYGCTSLTSVTIPDRVTSIANGAFSGCTNLMSVTIPDSVTSIGEGAFSKCTNLKSVVIPDGVTSIGDTAFASCTSLASVTIPDGVTSMGVRTFYGCTSLTGVMIPDSVMSIGEGAFSRCTSLKTMTIPDSVTSIGESVFEDCTILTSVTIFGSNLSIEQLTFKGCTSLTNVTLLGGVTSIKSNAFNGCRALTNIDFKGTRTQWENITKERGWDYNTGSYTVYCTDGAISKQ